ncbi:putative glutathione-specific gamma-glutamylcyclotransferase 2 [Amphibalanus amphitrite]|uniref:putative glutathione-specific gamma-glutamylcyclotransferase 2 n=1 Tax=Amphibalanus amphitrite TaxID=1232801 RepID=UPI001C909690|nr:putative glutathione-specific gamma-glutamylcyclotransferase 2 [Amphibalanus amphitrite]
MTPPSCTAEQPLPAGDCCSEEWSSSRDPRSEVAQESDRAHLWVFGYGSLCWKPGFSYRERRIGRVEGFSRRFWQGSVTHRGTPQQPGRVATLVEHRHHVGLRGPDQPSVPQGTTWGCAFLVTDRAALRYLDGREVVLGGYQTRRVAFVPRDPGRPPFAVTIYVATERNPLWLGEAPLARLAVQVAAARGRCGPNADYVLQLVRFMKRNIPEECDQHLFDLATLVEAAVGGCTSPAAAGAICPSYGTGTSPAGAICPSYGTDTLPVPGGTVCSALSGASSSAKPATAGWRRRCGQEGPEDAGIAETAQEPPGRCR